MSYNLKKTSEHRLCFCCSKATKHRWIIQFQRHSKFAPSAVRFENLMLISILSETKTEELYKDFRIRCAFDRWKSLEPIPGLSERKLKRISKKFYGVVTINYIEN